MSIVSELRREVDRRFPTRKAFADRMGVSQKHVCLTLQGKAGWTQQSLEEAAEALRCRWVLEPLDSS